MSDKKTPKKKKREMNKMESYKNTISNTIIREVHEFFLILASRILNKHSNSEKGTHRCILVFLSISMLFPHPYSLFYLAVTLCSSLMSARCLYSSSIYLSWGLMIEEKKKKKRKKI